MSKTQLKKELASLSAPQLRELILDLYTARRDSREYLDFFTNPDIEALTERYIRNISREISRGRYGRCTARISQIRRFIRDYDSLGPGADHTLQLMLTVLRLALIVEATHRCSEAFTKGVARLAADTLVYADRHLLYDQVYARVIALIDDTSVTSRGVRNIFRTLVQ